MCAAIQAQYAAAGTGAGLVQSGLADEFVQVKAEIEMLQWGAGLGGEEGFRPKSFEISAVIGRGKWVITNAAFKSVYSFDGSRLVTQGGFPKSIESADGNSGQEFKLADGSMGVRDQLDEVSRIMWLGFCSAPTLNNPKHKLYPPWEFWVYYMDAATLSNKVVRFEDDLGLPKNCFIFTDPQRIVVDYRVVNTTNVAGWTFPLEFYLLEYNPDLDKNMEKNWMLKMLAHCKVTAISKAGDPFSAGAKATAAARESKTGMRRFTAAAPSKIHIEGTSDVHDWSLDSTNVVGLLEMGERLLSGDASQQTGGNKTGGEIPAEGEFLFPVRYFSSGNAAPMFSDEADAAVLHRALHTTEYPNVVYRLRRLSPAKAGPHEGSRMLWQATGEVVIGGITNVLSMPVRVTRQDDWLTLSGSASVHLSDFGIESPSAKGNGWAVKVGDTIESTFELRLKEVE